MAATVGVAEQPHWTITSSPTEERVLAAVVMAVTVITLVFPAVQECTRCTPLVARAELFPTPKVVVVAAVVVVGALVAKVATAEWIMHTQESLAVVAVAVVAEATVLRPILALTAATARSS